MDNRNENLKSLLTNIRESTGMSQRQMAKKIGIHHSTLNDIENGKIQKIDITILIRLAEELGIDIKMLLSAAGYGKIIYLLDDGSNKIEKKATKNKDEKLIQYQLSQAELLEEIRKRAEKVKGCRARLNSLSIKLDNYDSFKALWTTDKINSEIKDIYIELEGCAGKYDYSFLPGKTSK